MGFNGIQFFQMLNKHFVWQLSFKKESLYFRALRVDGDRSQVPKDELWLYIYPILLF